MGTSNDKKIKCVIWDLDNTVWQGILTEDTDVKLNQKALKVIKELDNRGILQSIASKNDYDLTIKKLEEMEIIEYFIYPQINLGPKSESIDNIRRLINIGIDTIAFIDDQEFEREEVKFSFPEVICIETMAIEAVLDMEIMIPRFITEDSKLRRLLYKKDIERNKIEEKFNGTKEEFLASLEMVFTISPVTESDLKRVEELTVRTNQLNSTGYTYSYEELDNLRNSDKHKMLIAALDDKFGTYGKIGIVLIECNSEVWKIKLLLMSCRVMSRGVGSVFLNYVLRLAKEAGVKLQSEFVHTEKNRIMYITNKFAGFNEVDERDGVVILEHNLEKIQPILKYITLNIQN